MANILLLLSCVVGVYLGLTASTSIECDYRTYDWDIVINSYHCDVENDLQITIRESATITSVTGNHQKGMANSDVTSIRIHTKTCHYFPRDLETFFENLKMFYIYDSNLVELHQEDLKPFPKLVELHFHINSIEVIEEGLFDFNPDLEFIDFDSNEIVHISPTVFDHLSKLSTLRLQQNICINKDAFYSKSKVKKVIKAAKNKCDFSSLKTQLEDVKMIFKSEDFEEEFNAFVNTYNSSKIADFFHYKIQMLAQDEATTDTTIITETTSTEDSSTTEEIHLDTCSALEVKIETIVADLKEELNAKLEAIEKKLSKMMRALYINE